MTLTTQSPKEIKSGNGSTTVFSFTFVINQASDLTVIKTTTAGVESTLSEGSGTSNYSVSVSAYPGNGSITFPASGSTKLASGEKLTLKRIVDVDQDTDLVNQGAWKPSQVEDAFDYSRMIDLQQQEEMDRALKFATSADTSSFDMSIPAPVASKVVAINSSNNGFELVTEPSASASAAAASEVAAAASATSALAAASAVAFPYTFDNGTSMADPGTGDFRLNNGASASATAAALSNSTADSGNPDISDYIITMDDSSSTLNGHIVIVQEGTPSTFAIYTVGAVTDNTSWLQVGLTHVDSNGTFTNGTKCRLQFVRTGDKGETGATGPQGPTGATGPVGIGLALALG